MKRALVLLVIALFVPFLSSCFSTGKSAVRDTGDAVGKTLEGTGEGTLDIVEGVGKGGAKFGKGAAESVVGTGQATGQALVGRGGEARESGKVAAEAAGEGIVGVLEEPVKGFGKALQSIDKSIKEATEGSPERSRGATGNEDIK